MLLRRLLKKVLSLVVDVVFEAATEDWWSQKKQLDNEEQKIGAEIFRCALACPIRKIAQNVGVNGSVVVQKVLSNDDLKYGYNAARDCYEDLMEAGIMDPTKVWNLSEDFSQST